MTDSDSRVWLLGTDGSLHFRRGASEVNPLGSRWDLVKVGSSLVSIHLPFFPPIFPSSLGGKKKHPLFVMEIGKLFQLLAEVARMFGAMRLAPESISNFLLPPPFSLFFIFILSICFLFI